MITHGFIDGSMLKGKKVRKAFAYIVYDFMLAWAEEEDESKDPVCTVCGAIRPLEIVVYHPKGTGKNGKHLYYLIVICSEHRKQYLDKHDTGIHGYYREVSGVIESLIDEYNSKNNITKEQIYGSMDT